MDSITVFKPETSVEIAGGIDAIVLSVCINPNGNVEYKVVWFDGRTRRSEWMQACEVSEALCSEEVTIGFAGGA